MYLNESDPIYTQVQMYVSGMSNCDLFVYSLTGSIIVPVYIDEKFLEEVIPLCENFYFNYYLIALEEECSRKESLLGQNEINLSIIED